LIPASARTKASKAIEDIAKGIDPGEVKQEKKAAHRNAFTVADLVDEYMEHHAKRKKVTWREDLRCLNKEVIPAIGRRKAKDIRKRDIITIIDRIMERGSPAMANRAHSVIKKLFKFAVIRDILESSPYAFIPLPAEHGEKDRALEDAEVKLFWKGLDDSDMDPLHRLGLKFLLVTAQRRSEVIKAQWQEFDLDKREWEIPIERIKTRKKRKGTGPHLVPLSDLSISLLRKIKELSGDSQFVFPSNRTGQHLTPASITGALRGVMDEEYEDRIDIEYCTVHDLRRSGATGMARIGVQRFNISRVLNHSEQGMTQIYDKYDYLPEKKDALDRWGRKLESIITGRKAKVIELIK